MNFCFKLLTVFGAVFKLVTILLLGTPHCKAPKIIHCLQVNLLDFLRKLSSIFSNFGNSKLGVEILLLLDLLLDLAEIDDFIEDTLES